MFNWPHLTHGLAFEWRRIRRYDFAELAARAARRAMSLGLGLALLPLTVVLHFLGVRRVMVFTDRIGHLALEPDCLLKDLALGHVPRRRRFMLALPGRVANDHLLAYWEAFIPVVRHRAACFVLESMTRWGLMREDISRYLLSVRHAQRAYRVHAEWGSRPPLLSLTEDDRRWGADQLARLGVPPGAWFACVHVREPGFSPSDEELHSHRNGDIEAALPAIQEIVDRGGWVLRIGDPTMRQLPKMPRVIDYAHDRAKSERLDIVVCASARFILGNTSGIALVGTVFGVPCAVANLIPIPTLWFGPRDIGIPKLLWSARERRHLSLEEIMNSEIAGFRYAALYDEAGLRPDENEAEDIKALACEMMDRLEGCYAESDGDLARRRYVRALFRPDHYAFGSCATFGASYLRRHAETLGLPADPGAELGISAHPA